MTSTMVDSNYIFFRITLVLLILYLFISIQGCGFEDNRPSTPTNLQALQEDFQITISWDEVPNVSSYNLYYSVNEEINDKNKNQIFNVTTPYFHRDLPANVYYYMVTAVKGEWESYCSSQVDVDFNVERIKPQNVKTNIEVGQVILSWDDLLGVRDYSIYWSKTKGVTKANGIKIAGVSNPFVHSNLINGDTYYYTVTASNNYQESAISNELSGRPGVWDGDDITLWYNGNCVIRDILSEHLPHQIDSNIRSAIEKGEIGFCMIGDFSAWREDSDRYPVTYQNNSLMMNLTDIPLTEDIPNRFNIILYYVDTKEFLECCDPYCYLWLEATFSPADWDVLICKTSQKAEPVEVRGHTCMVVVSEDGTYRPVKEEEKDLVIPR